MNPDKRRMALHAPPSLRRARLASAAVLVSLLVVGGCAMGPDYQRPEVELPSSFGRAAPAAGALVPDTLPLPVHGTAQQPVTAGPAELVDAPWWQSFGDPQLDALIRIALDENKDLRIAALRVQQFQGSLDVARSERLPRVGVQALGGSQWLSENRQVRLPLGTDPTGEEYSVALTLGWELDLWGRISRSNEAAAAELLSVEENRRALVASLVSQIASTYLQLLSVDREIELIGRIVDSRRESVRLLAAKLAGGRIGEQPLLSARVELAQLESGLAAKEREAATLEHALATLIGRAPGPVVRGRRFDTLSLPAIPAGVPAQVIAQRPDVRQAEQDLVANNARIGVAKAQYFPVLALTGQNGFASEDLSKLTMLSSNFGFFGLTLLGPLFDGGRVAGLVREAEARQQASVNAYLRAVQAALREVEDALVWHGKMVQQGEARAREVQALAEQADWYRRREAGGAGELIEVLGAERLVYQGQLAQAQTRRDQALALIAVYKAMGGGWSVADHVPADLRKDEQKP